MLRGEEKDSVLAYLWQGRLMPRDVSYLKPNKFRNYLTLSELSRMVGRDPSWIRALERDDRIPKASRVKRGELEVRLWSPEQAKEIQAIIAQHRPGRPRSA